ncbi:PilZ domain-containing protein [Methylobacterium sp. J-048]|uniref:PilZ domain-containing protein n=1 Tax=Methylobacterium sp. J-048 TaxID=2836635 RepID=UPI00391CBC90
MFERRGKLRAKAVVPGRAALPGIDKAVRCIALDFSPSGACLLFPDGTTVPRMFELALGHEPAASAVRVVWRREDRVGVAFMAPRVNVPDVVPG